MYLNILDNFEDDLAHVLDYLNSIPAQWIDIATTLRLRRGDIEAIDEENKNSRACLRIAMKKWLKLNYNWEKNGKPSWRMLAKAVRQLDGGLFNRIAKDHSIEMS